MSKKDLKITLKEIGLSENESSVYLASMALGPTSVLQISRVAELRRTTVYSVIDELQKKGLMNIEISGFKKLYVAQDPKKLKAVLKKREDEFDSLLPEFEALYNLKQTGSEIRYYQGLESIKNALGTILEDTKPHDDYLVIADQENWYKQDPKFFQDFMERRAKKRLKIRMLLIDSELTREHKKFERNYDISIRILPKETKLTTDLCITPRHVMIDQIKEPVVSLMIDNQSIIETHREIFEMLWNANAPKA
jgi:sugar-specific transcriptional regulator TrmB